MNLADAEAMLAPIRVGLVDDHRSVLWGLEKLIQSAEPQMAVTWKAATHDEALEALRAHRADVVLLDLDLGGQSGVDLIRHMFDHTAPPRFLIVTGVQDSQLLDTAIVAGASGLVHKSEPAETILQAIRCVSRGELWLDRGASARVFDSMLKRDSSTSARAGAQDALTERERSIVAAVVEHRSAPNKVIADALHISSHTLRNHLSSIYEKVGVKRRLDLVLYAMERGVDRL